jgi:broad specificity phosphatase PhoE
MPAPEILLVRHGETEWSATGRHTGLSDVPLTEAGREQAQALGERLADREPVLVLTSPLKRALDTCRLAGFGDHAQIRDDLVEWDYGEYEGLTTAEIRRTAPGWTVWTQPTPGGETADAVGARCDRVLAELREVEGDAIVFAHGHILRVLAARWIGLGTQMGSRLALATGTLSIIGWERETQVVRAWNA